MNTRDRSISTKRRLLFLLMALLLVTGIIFTQAQNAVYAWIDDDPHDPVEPIHTPPPYTPSEEAFTWQMESRYGPDRNGDGMVDTFWIVNDMNYDKTYIFPDSWKVYFSGCKSQEDFSHPLQTPNLYTWEVLEVEGLVANVHRCIGVVLLFPAQGTYTVRLTVHDPSGAIVPAGKTNPEYFQQQITLRDILIVALGDSYSSGEGNPDIQQTYHAKPWPSPGWDLDTHAVWQDERCHRSAINGPSMAAQAIEYADPHSSVTFISFACAGATISRPMWDLGLWFRPLGSGFLGPHWGGADVGIPYSPTYVNYLSPQMDRLEEAMIPRPGEPDRQIDSLIISGGGNDMYFGDILVSCFLDDDCFSGDNTVHEDPWNDTDYTLENIIQRSLGHWGTSGPAYTLPDSYANLHGRINALQPAKPAHVYLTQYPDMTRDDDGTYCDLMDDNFVPNIFDNKINWMEARDAVRLALGPLNDHIREAAQLYAQDGWQYVDGLAVYDVDPTVPAGTPGLFAVGHDGKGHGYCASRNWIRRAEESELIQGPLNIRVMSKGQMHPNYGGHNAYKERLLRYMMPHLFTQQPQTPPVFSFSHSLNGYGDVVSADTGWYLESCTSDHQCQRKVVAQAVATSAVNLDGAQFTVNGVNGCTTGVIEGVSCVIPASDNLKQVTFNIEITASGIYQLRFMAADSSGQTASLEQEIRVDLDPPVLATPVGPFEVEEGGTVDLVANASAPDENVFEYEWDLDNDGVFETLQAADVLPVFSAADLDGPGSQTIWVQVTDRAGWIDTEQTTVNVLNAAPSVTITGAPDSVTEGTAIQLAGSATDPGSGDYITAWNWTMKKDGVTYAFSTGANSGFTPWENGSYEISLSVTDNDGGVGTASKTIAVTNVAPKAAFTGTPASGPEGTAISLSGSVTDPGIFDTFTYAWTVKKDGSSYTTGAGASYSFTPNDNGSYEVSLTVTDDDGGVGTAASQAVDVTNVAPTVAIDGTPATSPEGTAINVTKAVTDPGAADTFSYAWEVKKDGTSYQTGSEASFSFTPEDNGFYEVSLQVTDDDGGVGTASQTIDVLNVAPALDEVNYSPATVNEGDSVTISGGIGEPGTKDTLTLEINWGDGSPADTQGLAAGTYSFTASHTYADDNPTGTASDQNTITVKITDKDSASNSDTGEVTVNNLAPSLSITAPAYGTLYAVNTSVNLSGAFSDTGTQDTFSCSATWDDGVTTAGTLTTGGCAAGHSYSVAGVYTIQMTVSDDDTGSDTEPVMVVVYDPSAGFVTGGGWIDSPAGAYRVDPSLTGRAHFGFVSRYQKGATVPTGNTAFRFQAGGFEFDSTAYEWLVVNQNGANAQFKGTGLFNGAPDSNGNAYKFMVWAGDGSPDTFRIRIWWEDATGEHDVYDNGTDQAIGGGNIVIHNNR